MRKKRVAFSFPMRTAYGWNLLLASVFPVEYNVALFKAEVNRHILEIRYVGHIVT